MFVFWLILRRGLQALKDGGKKQFLNSPQKKKRSLHQIKTLAGTKITLISMAIILHYIQVFTILLEECSVLSLLFFVPELFYSARFWNIFVNTLWRNNS